VSIRRETSSGPSELERILAARGVPAKLEARAGLAVLVVDRGTMTALSDPELRRATLTLAREHGFTHVAVELRDDAAQ